MTTEVSFFEAFLRQRPFAVETGPEEWSEQFGHLVSTVLGQQIGERSVRTALPPNIRTAAAVMAAEVGREACEMGFHTRNEPQIMLPSAYTIAETVLGDDFKKLRDRHRPSSPDKVLEAHSRLDKVIPRVTEISYLWGRHGRILGLHDELPTVIRDPGLTTIRPEAIYKRTESVTKVLSDVLEGYEPYEASVRERVMARFFRKSCEDLWVKEWVSERDALKAVRTAIQNALEDLAKE